MTIKPNLVIAIDGHSSCGKSTVAKDLAKQLGIAYIDTGAMYRTVTLYALRHGLIADGRVDEQALTAALDSIRISFSFNADTKKNETFLNGQSVETEIRSLPVSQNVSAISAISAVRHAMVRQQQQMGSRRSIVMDGRDIGTVVFPNADLKIFMTASAEIRAQRRFDELTAKGQTVSYADILDNVRQRDHIDSTRAESPLRQAPDALLLDNGQMTMQQQFDWIMDALRSRRLITD